MKISMFQVIKKCVQKSIYIQWSIKNTNRDRLRFWDKQIKKNTFNWIWKNISAIKTKISPEFTSNTPTIFISIIARNTTTIYIKFLIRSRAVEFWFSNLWYCWFDVANNMWPTTSIFNRRLFTLIWRKYKPRLYLTTYSYKKLNKFIFLWMFGVCLCVCVCVCVCVCFVYAISISIICVSQEEPSLLASNE